MEPQPIETDAEYEAALETIDRLMVVKELTPEQLQQLESLVQRVQEYEALHYPID